MQKAGYFVLLVFVGLTSADLSILRVTTRVQAGGHGVNEPTLRKRFPKTQKAISAALNVADASILADNSLTPDKAFTVCRAQLGAVSEYDIRGSKKKTPPVISAWLDVVAPLVD